MFTLQPIEEIVFRCCLYDPQDFVIHSDALQSDWEHLSRNRSLTSLLSNRKETEEITMVESKYTKHD